MGNEPVARLSVLGPIEMWVGDTPLALPRSKKARALLAYLATSGHPQRRDRLCSLLWDVTDDPRGALRWTLSRLRKALGAVGDCLVADREHVELRPGSIEVDALVVVAAVRGGLSDWTTERLEQLAARRRGEFIEGLELLDFLDFNAWCIAERDRHREYQCTILRELTARLHDDPRRALPHARQRAQIDPLDVSAQLELLQLLIAASKPDEARHRFDSARRMFAEVQSSSVRELDQGWRAMRSAAAAGGERPRNAPVPTPSVVAPPVEPSASVWPFVGRKQELEQLERRLAQTRAGSAPVVALVIAEPGAGKSRLAERLAHRASSGGFAVLSGKAYEAESSRPYGPWAEALQVDVQELIADGLEGSLANRDTLFATVCERLAAQAIGHGGVMLVLDDVQWLDRDSAELVHYVTRMFRAAPLFIVMLARSGELGDNEACVRTLRGIRKESQVEELHLEPLSKQDVAALVGTQAGVDVDRVWAASAGNPLYAIELARAQARGSDETPPSVAQLVRERVEQLPSAAADVLRWCAVMGHAVDADRLEALSSLSMEELVDALEHLERHALLRIDASRSRQRLVFAHDVVREAVYGELSQPRRRLMHRKVALALEGRATDATVATVVAHHAGLAGEALLGVKACIAAGTQSLRVFANGDAESLARRGARLAEDLEDSVRIPAMLDLLALQYSARTPDRDEAARRVRVLADRALDLGLMEAARLGFQMVSYLRWESASLADAHANIMQAERISRSGTPEERSVALAQAAKCLVLLEKNLGQAEAFAMEATALASRARSSTSALAFANGMISAYRGDDAEALASLTEARQLARVQGERLVEFGAVEHWVMLEIDRGGHAQALPLAEALAELGTKVRPGAEAATGRGLMALARILGGTDEREMLRGAIDELRVVDAKYELAYLLTRWAEHELAVGRIDAAQALGHAGLEVAGAVGRASEEAIARVVLAGCADRAADAAASMAQRDALCTLGRRELSRAARTRVATLMGASVSTIP